MKIYAKTRNSVDLSRCVGRPFWLLVSAANGIPEHDRYIKIITLNNPDNPKWPVTYYSISSYDIEYKSGVYDISCCTQAALNRMLDRFNGEIFSDEEMMEMIGATEDEE